MSVILLGYRGSGKTTVGRLVAARLGMSFADVDELVVRSAGRNIREIFEAEGEKGFRDREARAVAEALGLPGHVVSLGGGAVLRPETRDALTATARERVYLRCAPESLAARIAADPATAAARPNLVAGSRGPADVDEINRVLAAREPLYRQVMTRELDVTYLSPADVTQAILQCLQS
jgi:shikimate kinase